MLCGIFLPIVVPYGSSFPLYFIVVLSCFCCHCHRQHHHRVCMYKNGFNVHGGRRSTHIRLHRLYPAYCAVFFCVLSTLLIYVLVLLFLFGKFILYSFCLCLCRRRAEWTHSHTWWPPAAVKDRSNTYQNVNTLFFRWNKWIIWSCGSMCNTKHWQHCAISFFPLNCISIHFFRTEYQTHIYMILGL